MPGVYQQPIDDDDVVLVNPPPPPPPPATDPARMARKPSSRNSPRKNPPSNSQPDKPIKADVIIVREQHVVPATSSSPRSPARAAGGADVKMEDTGPGEAMETDGGGGAEKQEEINHLPNKDISDPLTLTLPSDADDSKKPPPQVTSAVDDASASTNVDEKPSSPLLNGVGAPADEKSKKPASTSVKPKSKRRSPSPEPLPPPPRLQTIRLDISLGGPDNYAVDIVQLSKETGQRPPTPPPPLKLDVDSTESEGEDGPSTSRKDTVIPKGKGVGKAGRKSTTAEYYDLNDPFIDDSELAMDERTYFAQTKQQGFYVSSGEVALMKDKTRDKESRERDTSALLGVSPTKKPKSKRNLVPTIIPLAGSQAVNAAVASSTPLSINPAAPTRALSQPVKSPTEPFGSQHLPPGHGTRETPITLSDTEEGKLSASTAQLSISVPNGVSASSGALKRKASEAMASASTGKKKRKSVDIESFHPELQVALNELRVAISRESFDQKGKFPPALKPVLARVALKAISVGEYNDNFFALMPKLFIYNKYTMTKLIKRTVYADHQKLLLARQDELIEELGKLAQEGFEKAKEEHEKSVEAWERRQEKLKAGATTSVEGTPAPESTTPSVNGATLPPSHADTGADSSMEVDGPPPTQGQADKESGSVGPLHSSQHMPIQRFRLTDRMRNIIWELVVLSNESVRIENEKNSLENSTVQVSEQGTRKTLYQKVVAAFPEGWMSSGQISREVSVMKKRYEAQMAEGVS